MIKKANILIVLLLVLSLCLFGCGSKDVADKTEKAVNLALGTSGSGSGVYILGGVLCDVVNKNQEALIVSPQVTAGFEENLGLVNDNKIALAEVSTNNLAAGMDKFSNITGVFNYTIPPLHLVVDGNKNINSIEDLKGKKVNLGAPGQSTRKISEMLLSSYGLTADDYKISSLPTGESIEALKDGQVDAIIVIAYAPMPGIAELALTKNIAILPIEGSNADKFNEAMSFSLVPSKIPAGSYKGIDQEIITVSPPMTIIANKDLDTELVYQFTKATWENLDELGEANDSLKSLTLDKTVFSGWNNLPLHPGAEKYFKEVGILD
ncbi:MAG: TRAP transporter solute receptor, TAXI family [Clostridiales bacterium 38_11]|nr:MAG: TRAP transporter solute receptor, TAXI family [Clostridiales bacterium 38_11]